MTSYGGWEREKRVLNKKETTIAAQKQDTMRGSFQDWVFRDQERQRGELGGKNTMYCLIPPDHENMMVRI